jgi:flagellar protein FliO/FliZ
MIRRSPIAALAGAGAACAAVPAFAAPGLEAANLSTMIMSLALVVGFIFAAAFVAKRMPLGFGSRSHGPLKVLAALPLGPKERLLLVEARGEELLIAVSPAGVFNVGAQAQPGTPAAPPTAPTPKFVLQDAP